MPGSYKCECLPGYTTTDQDRCIDIDECALYFNPCGEGKGTCTNKAPGYECQCDKGYRLVIDGSDQTCVDVDECEEGQVNCGEHGTCVNTGGSYECVCQNGYK